MNRPSPLQNFTVGWNNVTASPSPSSRMKPAVAFDGSTGTQVLFGGLSGTSLKGDTWSYRGGIWSNISTLSASKHPSQRYGSSMTYDALDRYVVLFGGCSGVTGCGGGSSSSVLGDTWLFLQNGTWQNVTAQQTQSPSARTGAAMTYDSAGGCVALFGGVSPGILPAWNLDGDTWAFFGGQWSLLIASSGFHPPARRNASLAFLPTNTSNRPFASGGAGYDGTVWRDRLINLLFRHLGASSGKQRVYAFRQLDE